MSSFHSFNSFPPEIHSMILESCPSNDAICLRLTCKHLYSLAPSKEPISLENADIGILCGSSDTHGHMTWSTRYMHRQECHQHSYKAICKLNEASGKRVPDLKNCGTKRWTDDCECFPRRSKLHHRISKWMPQGLNYCGQCEKFTRRKKGHNGRCYHGRSKKRKLPELFWKHRPRNGAFGYDLWKKWFNNNAMNKYEARLRRERVRNGVDRYSLRKLEPKLIDTRMSRESLTWLPGYL